MVIIHFVAGNHQSIVATHSNALVDDYVFVWGGDRLGLPKVHDSLEKRKFTKSVDSFNLLNSSFVKKPTELVIHLMQHSTIAVAVLVRISITSEEDVNLVVVTTMTCVY